MYSLINNLFQAFSLTAFLLLKFIPSDFCFLLPSASLKWSINLQTTDRCFSVSEFCIISFSTNIYMKSNIEVNNFSNVLEFFGIFSKCTCRDHQGLHVAKFSGQFLVLILTFQQHLTPLITLPSSSLDFQDLYILLSHPMILCWIFLIFPTMKHWRARRLLLFSLKHLFPLSYHPVL